MVLRAAADEDAYRAAPAGAHLALRHALVFCATRGLWGFALWGRPSEADTRRLLPLLALELGAAPHASLVDARRLEAGDPRAFGALAGYLREHFEALRAKVTRLALVRPPGVLGATVAGFFQVAGAPYPVRVFDELAAAAAWLGARGVARELDAAIASASRIAPRVLELGRWLEHHPEAPSLARAARALARAPRSLQRDLRAAGTTFSREVARARVRLAQQLIAGGDAPFTEIAYEVGCASPQHFSTLFHRVAGVTPSVWRRRMARR